PPFSVTRCPLHGKRGIEPGGRATMIRAATACLAVLLAVPAWGQQDATPDPVLQAKIDDAIRKGVVYLKTAESVVAWQEFGGNSDELILWTFVHADVSTKDPVFQTLLQRMLSA